MSVRVIGSLDFADIGSMITTATTRGELRGVNHSADITTIDVLLNPDEPDHPRYEMFDHLPNDEIELTEEI